MSFSKGFALYQYKRGLNAWFYKSGSRAIVMQMPQTQQQFRRGSNAKHCKSSSVQSVLKAAGGSCVICCEYSRAFFRRLWARLQRFPFRVFLPLASSNADAALAFLRVMDFGSGKMRCVYRQKCPSQRPDNGLTRRCTRPPTASLPSLVPRFGRCASGGG